MASDRTNERRERMLEMFAKPDMAIAKKLVSERFFGSVPRGAEDRERHLDAARRTIAKDREWWREQWREAKREIASGETRMHTEEYVARLRSRLGDVEEVLEDALVKSTARVQAIDTAVRIETAMAKARGIDQLAPADPDGSGPSANVPFFGVFVSLEKLPAESQKRVNEWIDKRSIGE